MLTCNRRGEESLRAPWSAWNAELENSVWVNDKFPANSEQDFLLQLNAHESTESSGIHLRVLTKLADVIRRFLSTVFQSFGNLERSLLTVSWQTLSQVSRKVDLSVSFVRLIKLQRRLFCDLVKNTRKTVQSLVITSTDSQRESPV